MTPAQSEALVRKGLAIFAEEFDNDRPIDCGDLVELFSEWRRQAKHLASRNVKRPKGQK